jgi:hypothetical protein
MRWRTAPPPGSWSGRTPGQPRSPRPPGARAASWSHPAGSRSSRSRPRWRPKQQRKEPNDAYASSSRCTPWGRRRTRGSHRGCRRHRQGRVQRCGPSAGPPGRSAGPPLAHRRGPTWYTTTRETPGLLSVWSPLDDPACIDFGGHLQDRAPSRPQIGSPPRGARRTRPPTEPAEGSRPRRPPARRSISRPR